MDRPRDWRTAKLEIPYQLFRQRDLLELHLVNASRGGAQQRAGCEQDRGLHVCSMQEVLREEMILCLIDGERAEAVDGWLGGVVGVEVTQLPEAALASSSPRVHGRGNRALGSLQPRLQATTDNSHMAGHSSVYLLSLLTATV